MEDLTVHVARAVVFVVLLTSGLFKLSAGWDASVETVRRYAVLKPRLAARAAFVLIGAELVAAVLLVTPFYRAGALVGAAVFAAAGLAVSAVLTRGESIDCGCFGNALSIQTSPWLLCLDLVLLATCLFLVAAGGVFPATSVYLVLTIAAVLLVGMTLQSVRANFFPTFFVSLPAGSRFEPFTAETRQGERIDSATLADRGAVFLFASPDCPACLSLVRRIDWYADRGVPYFLVTDADDDSTSVFDRELGVDPSRWIIDKSGRLARHFKVVARPTALAIREHRVAGTVFPATPERIQIASTALSKPLHQ